MATYSQAQPNVSKKESLKRNPYVNLFDSISQTFFYRNGTDHDFNHTLDQIAQYAKDLVTEDQTVVFIRTLIGARNLAHVDACTIVNKEYESDDVFKAITSIDEGLEPGRDIYQTLRLLGYTTVDIKNIIFRDLDPEDGENKLHTSQAWFEFILENVTVTGTQQTTQRDFVTQSV